MIAIMFRLWICIVLSLLICLYFKLSYQRVPLRYFKKGFNVRKFGNYNIVSPATVSSIVRTLPKNIALPSYYKPPHSPPRSPPKPEIKDAEQIKGMRDSCRLAREVLDAVHSVIKPGITTDDVDAFVHDKIVRRNAYPSPLNYRGFPKSVCTSVNNVVCHGVPDSRPLQDGDIINVDISVYYNGFHGDCSAMYTVGNVDSKGKHLVRITLEALNEAIKVCKPGQLFSKIGHTIEEYATINSLNVVPDYAGHGIGSYFHGPPDIYHYANREGGRMAAGMTFTIEPILSQGSPKMVILDDGWTSVTLDGSRTAQWEHTVLITKKGVEIITGPEYKIHE